MDIGAPIYDKDNSLIGIVIAFQDETEKRYQKKILQESEKKYKDFFSNDLTGDYISSIEGKLLDCNPAFVEMFGYQSKEELLSINTSYLYPTQQDRRQFLELLSQNKSIEGFESTMVRKDGKEINCIENVVGIFDDNGKLTQFMGYMFDITARKKMISELVAAKDKAEESDRLKTAFLHNISHEIRTPMNAIIGFSALLNDPAITPEARQDFTNLIEQSSNQLLSIITDLIDIATIEAGQAKIQEKEININEICLRIHNQFLLMARDQNVTFEYKTSLSEKEAVIISDETKLFQILCNIVCNAFKFTIQGSVRFGYNLKDNNIEFYIEDTGIGIPKEMQEDVFIRFHQVENSLSRQYGGNGLGLSISKAYVELLGGKIWLTSELNKGSVFYFTIPYKKVITRQKLCQTCRG